MKFLRLIFFFFALLLSNIGWGQCNISATIIPDTAADIYPNIYCGQSIQLKASGYGDGTVLLHSDFNNSTFGSGWSSTPGAVDFSNPCGSGVDGSPSAWMGSNTTVPRDIVSQAYDLSSATAGVTICFDLKFATQGNAAPCEGPDEPQEGLYLQYSTDGGNTWQTIHYFDPNGGNDPDLINWKNWCFQIPTAALTSSTQFRWHQDNDSGKDYDHWGIDNVDIVVNDVDAEIVWGSPGDDYYYDYGAGNPGGLNPAILHPTSTTSYYVKITTGTNQVCDTTLTLEVKPPNYSADLTTVPDPPVVCQNNCVQVSGSVHQVIDSGGITTYANNELQQIVSIGSLVGASIDINVQGLNTTNITAGMIKKVCIDKMQMGIGGIGGFGGDLSDFVIKLTSPGGCQITLVPVGEIASGTGEIDDMCFVPIGGAPISSGSEPYTGQFDPDGNLSDFNGCQANGEWTMEINSSGIASFGTGTFYGWNITFDNPPIVFPATASWSPTAGVSNPNDVNTQICPQNLGANNYTLTVSNGNAACATQDFPLVITKVSNCSCTPPSITVLPTSICNATSINLTDSVSNPDNANLTFYNSQTDAQNSTNAISNTIATAGTYWVRAEDPSDATCFTVQKIVVTDCNCTPPSITVLSTSICNATSINLTDSVDNPGNANLTFYNSQTDAQNSTNAISNTIATAGTYWVRAEDPSDATCFTVQKIVVTDCNCTPPTITTTPISSCDSTADLMDAVNNPGNANLSYYDSENDAENGTNVINSIVDSAGTYWVRAEDPTDPSCYTVEKITFSIGQPNASFTGLQNTYCINDASDTLIPLENGGTFSGDGMSASVFDPSTAGIGTHTVTYIISSGTGCADTVTKTVVVSGPTADFDANPVVTDLNNTTIEFTNHSTNATSYTWNFGDSSAISNDTNATHTFPDDVAGTYTVILTATDANGCTDQKDIIIHIVNPNMKYKLPNVFTPNGDGSNDVFKFVSYSSIKSIHINILNRWGNPVFESDKIDFKWNGQKGNSGSECSDGVYFYQIEITSLSGNSVKEEGFIHLVRAK